MNSVVSLVGFLAVVWVGGFLVGCWVLGFCCCCFKFHHPPPLFHVKDQGPSPSVCFYSYVAFLLLCLSIYKMRQIILPYSERTSWRITDKSTDNIFKLCRFLRDTCVFVIPALSNSHSVQITQKKGSKHIQPPHQF